MTTVAEAQRLFSPETVYLNTATYGLPPRPAHEALLAAADEWRHGRTGFWGWDESVGAARASFARLHGVEADDVAVGSQASAFAALVALSLARGARVVTAEEDFTSVLWPFLAQAGLQVQLVPLDRVAEAVDGNTALVAVSAVQSFDGRLADLDAIEAAAAHHGALTYLDATQAAGWLPLDAGRFDYMVASGYKWLMNPRGTSFFAIRPDAAERLRPHLAGWYAGDDPVETNYGAPLRLAGNARRFDVSPAWLSWVGAAPALALLEDVGIRAVHDHDVGLANRFRAGLGMPAGDSAIVAVDLDAAAGERWRAAGVMATERSGLTRFSFHLSTSEHDVDRALEAIQLRH
ncbi:MAG TPA: aminotransferase class V-fold PLP-dependent enzyme [Solirubrobacteraceae bacterium]|nr:aminotransferase class V-fold PLP-dependent enzyme [Solirubrobacteraceae bacterium]